MMENAARAPSNLHLGVNMQAEPGLQAQLVGEHMVDKYATRMRHVCMVDTYAEAAKHTGMLA